MRVRVAVYAIAWSQVFGHAGYPSNRGTPCAHAKNWPVELHARLSTGDSRDFTLAVHPSP